MQTEQRNPWGDTENTSCDGESENYYVTWRKGQNGTWTITNIEKEKTEVTAVKAWLNADGTNTPPAGASIVFELFEDGVTTGKTVHLNGRQDVAADPDDTQELIAAAGNSAAAFESTAWAAKWTDLPKYHSDGETEIIYTIKEVASSIPAEYEADYGTNPDGQPRSSVLAGETITNKQLSASLKIVKVDANGMIKLLEGAGFELRRIDPDSVMISYLDENAVLPETNGKNHKTGTDGEALFAELTAGYYQVKETDLPEGYVQIGDGVFYVKVENGSITHVNRTVAEDDQGVSHVIWTPGTDSDKFTFTAASEETPATAIVGNDVGVALPHTGGPGLKLFLFFGSVLLLGAGLLMQQGRRRHN